MTTKLSDLREALAAYEEFYEFDPPENQMTWEPVLAAAARRFLALTETGPDYEAAAKVAMDTFSPDVHTKVITARFYAKAIVKAALADYLTEEDR